MKKIPQTQVGLFSLFFFIAQGIFLQGCADPRNSATEDTESPDETTDESVSESYIANTGGRAISADGLLTILVGPNVFPDGAGMRIQAQNSQMPGARGQEYFVSLNPADVAIQAGGRFTVQYSGADPLADDGLLSLGQRGEGDTELQSLTLFRLTDASAEPPLWQLQTSTLGVMSIHDASQTSPCACDEGETTCDDTCVCSEACGLINIDPSDASDPSDPTDSSDPSDQSDSSDSTIGCGDDQFECGDTSCIPQNLFCNGLPDCNDGSDELDCGGGGTGGSVEPDSFEPDNSFATASSISVGESQTRTLPVGDQDMILLETSEAYEISIATSGTIGGTTVRLLASSGGELAAGDTWNDFGSLSYAPLPAGQYYIEITQGYWSSEDTRYTLSVSGQPALALPPSNVTAERNEQDVTISWNPVDGALSYDVGYTTLSIGDILTPDNTTDTSYTFTNLPRGETYYFGVRAQLPDGLTTYYSTYIAINVPVFTDPFEPDNSAAEASVVTDGYSEEHSLHNEMDSDWFKFELIAPATVTLTSSGPAGGDTYLRLYDSTATTSIAYNDYQGANEYGIITRSLEAGTYYLEVYQGYSSEATPSYLMEIEFEYATSDPLSPDEFENNDTSSSATALAVGITQNHSLHREGDTDYFEFTLDSLSRVTLEASGDISLLQMTLLNDAGETLAQAVKDTDDSVLLDAEFVGAGTYFVKVQNQVPQVLSENYGITLAVTSYPPQPRNIAITQDGQSLTVSWDTVPGATEYNVDYRASSNPFAEATEGSSPLNASSNSATLSGLPLDGPIYVWVRAVKGDLVGPYSQATIFTP